MGVVIKVKYQINVAHLTSVTWLGMEITQQAHIVDSTLIQRHSVESTLNLC